MYATQQDLIDRFGQEELVELTDRADPPAGVIDATVVTRALTDADALIDGYVGARYDLPLSSTPALLVDLAADIARYKLYKDDPTEAVESRNKAALATLRDISTGKAKLDIAGAEPATSGAGAPEVSAPDRLFTRDTLDGF